MRYRQRIAVSAYFVLQILWIVSVDQGLFYASDVWTVAVFSVIGLSSIGLGFATRSWAAPAFPFVTVALALPLGLPSGNFHEPLPTWFGVLLLAPVEAVLVALGVAGRRSWEWWGSVPPA